jgi:beta-glucanase (GH16 family)
MRCRFRTITVATVAFVLSPLVALMPKTTAASSFEKPGWVLTFDDEFNGNKLDPTVWNVTNTASYINEEQQYYMPDCVQVAHGYLRIKTLQKYYRGRSYVSGQINSQHRFSQCYGWFETRMRFPTTVGLWSCFYLLPESGAWPPEIDVAEYLTRSPQDIYLTNHWLGSDHRHWSVSNDVPVDSFDFTQWHIYAVDWEPGSVQWFIDGRLMASTISSWAINLQPVHWYIDNQFYATAPPTCVGWPYGPKVIVSQVPMFLQINDCIGSFGGPAENGPWPQYIDVDYVRVYRHVKHRHWFQWSN